MKKIEMYTSDTCPNCTKLKENCVQFLPRKTTEIYRNM